MNCGTYLKEIVVKRTLLYIMTTKNVFPSNEDHNFPFLVKQIFTSGYMLRIVFFEVPENPGRDLNITYPVLDDPRFSYNIVSHIPQW